MAGLAYNTNAPGGGRIPAIVWRPPPAHKVPLLQGLGGLAAIRLWLLAGPHPGLLERTIMTACKLGVCLLAISVAATGVAEARGCASPSEVSAIQISAVQQELTDAALACGPRDQIKGRSQPYQRFGRSQVQESPYSLTSSYDGCPRLSRSTSVRPEGL